MTWEVRQGHGLTSHILYDGPRTHRPGHALVHSTCAILT